MYHGSIKKLAITVTLLGVLASAERAEAKGFMLITYGDDITHVADIPPGTDAPAGLKVGYKYGAFGVFWLDIWTWDGEFVLYRGDNYQTLEAAGISVDEMSKIVGKELKKPWGYSFPPGLIIIVLLVGGYIAYSVYSKKQAAKTQALFDDERYQTALQMLMPEEGEEAKSFEEAVDYLVDQRIPRDEARKNLSTMVQTIAEMAEDAA